MLWDKPLVIWGIYSSFLIKKLGGIHKFFKKIKKSHTNFSRTWWDSSTQKPRYASLWHSLYTLYTWKLNCGQTIWEYYGNPLETHRKHIGNIQKTKNALNPSTPKPKRKKLNTVNACQAFIGYMKCFISKNRSSPQNIVISLMRTHCEQKNPTPPTSPKRKKT